GGAEQVGFQDRDSGAGGVVGGDLADEQGNVDVRGTGLYAGGIETVEAAVGLERGFTVRHLRLDFTEAFAQRLEVWLRRAGGTMFRHSSNLSQAEYKRPLNRAGHSLRVGAPLYDQAGTAVNVDPPTRIWSYCVRHNL